MAKITYVLGDSHTQNLSDFLQYLLRFHDVNVVCTGDFSENPLSINSLMNIQKIKPSFIKTVGGNHEDAYKKGKVITSKSLKKNNLTYWDVRNFINGSSLRQSYIEKLVKIQDENAEKKIIETVNTGNKKMMVLHGCPIITETENDVPEGLNKYLWSRLVNEKNMYIPEKIQQTFDFIEQNNLSGLYRGHDHSPSLFIKSNSENNQNKSSIIAFTELGTFYLKDQEFIKLNDKSIYKQKIITKPSDKIILNPGAFEHGSFAEVKSIYADEINDDKLEIRIRKFF